MPSTARWAPRLSAVECIPNFWGWPQKLRDTLILLHADPPSDNPSLPPLHSLPPSRCETVECNIVPGNSSCTAAVGCGQLGKAEIWVSGLTNPPLATDCPNSSVYGSIPPILSQLPHP